MRILLISYDYPPAIIGGQGVYAAQLAGLLRDAGHEITVITSGRSSRNGQAGERDTVILPRSGSPLAFAVAVRGYLSSHDPQEYDVIHSNDIYAFAVMGNKDVQKRIVTTCHNSYLQRMNVGSAVKRPLYRLLMMVESYALKRSRVVLAVSDRTAAAAGEYGINKESVRIVYNAVNTSRFTPPAERPESPIRLLFVGRLVTRKHPEAVLNIIEDVRRTTGKQVTATIVGDGPLRGAVQSGIIERGLESVVRMQTAVDHNTMPQIYRDHHAFILPSKGEGLPLVLLEAAASGMALFATHDATGGTPIIRQDTNGAIIDWQKRKDTAGMIMSRLKNLDAYGKASRLIAERTFSEKSMLAGVLDAYSFAVRS